MEYSTQDLEHLQRAAGVFGLTVDELIQRGRAPSAFSNSVDIEYRQCRDVPGSGSPDAVTTYGNDYYIPSEQSLPIQHPQHWCEGPYALGQPGFGAPQLYQIGWSGLPTAVRESQSTEVILLNPHSAFYACNAEFPNWPNDFEVVASEWNRANRSDMNEDESYVQVTLMQSVSDDGSESMILDKRQDVVSDEIDSEFSLVPASVGLCQPDRLVDSISATSSRRQYALIAPKPGKLSPLKRYSSLEPQTYTIRKRKRYDKSDRDDTNLTRQIHACIRCKLQRNRVGT